jgi:hypothetical protein
VGAQRRGREGRKKVGWDFFVKEMGRGIRGDVREGCGLKKWGENKQKNINSPFCPF